MNRRSFLKVGALFVPALAAQRVAYSFLPGDPHAALAGLAADEHPVYPRVTHWLVRDTAGTVVYEGKDSSIALQLHDVGIYYVSARMGPRW